MNKLLVITYDLRPEATPKDYVHLARGLNSLGATRLLLASWAIKSAMTPAALAQAIAPYLDVTADRLLIVEVVAHAEMNTERSLDSI